MIFLRFSKCLQPQTKGLLLIAVLLGLICEPVSAVTYEIDQSHFDSPVLLSVLVKKFKKGDSVKYPGGRAKDGTKIPPQEFVLGEFLGHGLYGYVFALANSPGKVVKFQSPGVDFDPRKPQLSVQAREAMSDEVTSLRALKALRIPHAECFDFDCKIYIKKERVTGPTLANAFNFWKNYSELTQDKMIQHLAALIDTLESLENVGSIIFNDIHAGNVMWDSKKELWKVVDPGKIDTRGSNVRQLLGFIRRRRNIYDLFAASHMTGGLACYRATTKAIRSMQEASQDSPIALTQAMVSFLKAVQECPSPMTGLPETGAGDVLSEKSEVGWGLYNQLYRSQLKGAPDPLEMASFEDLLKLRSHYAGWFCSSNLPREQQPYFAITEALIKKAKSAGDWVEILTRERRKSLFITHEQRALLRRLKSEHQSEFFGLKPTAREASKLYSPWTRFRQAVDCRRSILVDPLLENLPDTTLLMRR